MISACTERMELSVGSCEDQEQSPRRCAGAHGEISWSSLS